MGLDLVELVMEVEDAFDISIPDDRAVQIVTVGDLYEAIVESKAGNPRSACLSAPTFYLIRRALVSETGTSPQSLRPRTAVDEALPAKGRRMLWKKLTNDLNLKFPTLCRPKWLVSICTLTTIATSVALFVFGYQEWGLGLAVWLGFLSLACLGMIASWVTVPFATLPRHGFETLRGLTKVVLALNYAKLSEKFDAWNPTEAWDALRLIIVEQLGVKPDVVTIDASFVRDLKAG